MPELKKNYFQRRSKPKGPRSNHRINSPDVQVISSEGENLGIISTNKAISMAKDEGCLLYTSPSPRDKRQSRMPSSA